ncbi:MAG TPA: hypothetical protein VH593_05140 [Ktedonobacteraceae bacterium]
MSNTSEPFSSRNDHLEEIEQPEETEQPGESEVEQSANAPESTEEQPEEGVERYPASTLPPVESEEAHGGPLGCCLGVVVGMFLTMLLMLSVSLALSNGGFLGIATAPIALLGGCIGGYFGWRIGRAVYRVYEPPVIIDKRHRSKKSRSKVKWF